MLTLFTAILAQTPEVDPSLPWWAQAWFLGLVTAVTSIVLPIVKKILNENWKAAASSNIDDIVFDTVMNFGELRVKSIKADAADNVITEEEKKAQLGQTLEDAIKAVTNRFGGEKKAAKVLGVQPTEVAEVIEGKIERVVTAGKAAGGAPVPRAPAQP